MKSNINKIFFGVFVLAMLTSCDDKGYDKYEQESAPSVAMNGEWFIQITDSEGHVLVDHALHKTFDTNDGGMMITDRLTATSFSGWWLESRLDIDTENLTFSATNAENTSDGSIVNITEGKVLKRAAKSPTGAVVDSIYFKGEFDYDPGNILTFAGYKRTGFLEEE